jgi:anti-anti-sigma factor
MNTTIAIEGELTVFTAHDTKTRLLGAMSPQGELTVELGDVSEFDGAGLQLLLATHHEAARRGGALRLVSPSSHVSAVLQLAGLTDHFDISASAAEEATS